MEVGGLLPMLVLLILCVLCVLRVLCALSDFRGFAPFRAFAQKNPIPSAYSMPISSTSNFSVALGGMTPPAPREP
jgi:hypothetical protein